MKGLYALLFVLAMSVCACSKEQPAEGDRSAREVPVADWEVQKPLDGADAVELVRKAKEYLAERHPDYSLENRRAVAIDPRSSDVPSDRQEGDSWKVIFYTPIRIVDGVKLTTLGGDAAVYIDKHTLAVSKVQFGQ